MFYRNTKTGAVIETHGPISGPDYEEVKPEKKPARKKTERAKDE